MVRGVDPLAGASDIILGPSIGNLSPNDSAARDGLSADHVSEDTASAPQHKQPSSTHVSGATTADDITSDTDAPTTEDPTGTNHPSPPLTACYQATVRDLAHLMEKVAHETLRLEDFARVWSVSYPAGTDKGLWRFVAGWFYHDNEGEKLGGEQIWCVDCGLWEGGIWFLVTTSEPLFDENVNKKGVVQ